MNDQTKTKGPSIQGSDRERRRAVKNRPVDWGDFSDDTVKLPDILVKILDCTPVPMVIIDEHEDFLLINLSFVKVFGYDHRDLPDIAKWWSLAYPDPEYRRQMMDQWRNASRRASQTVDYDAPGRLATVTCKDGSTRIVEVFGANVGPHSLVILKDITPKIEAEQEQQRLIVELREALDEVKKLSGLLPICAHCKKIRDDKGYWQQIESYLQQHSEAQFSHGICPDCLEKLYPEVKAEKNDRSRKSDD